MGIKIKVAVITASAVILTSATLAFSADQMHLPVKDTTKTLTTVVDKDTAVAPKLKPQTSCPVMNGSINKKLFVDYKGKRIFVCCGGCIAEVKKDPDAAIKKLAEVGQEPETIITKKVSVTDGKKADVKDTSVKK